MSYRFNKLVESEVSFIIRMHFLVLGGKNKRMTCSDVDALDYTCDRLEVPD